MVTRTSSLARQALSKTRTDLVGRPLGLLLCGTLCGSALMLIPQSLSGRALPQLLESVGATTVLFGVTVLMLGGAYFLALWISYTAARRRRSRRG